MSKWADYVIVDVKYDDDNSSRIAKVERGPDLGDKLGKRTVEKRMKIVDDIKEGYTHVTAYWKNDGG